LAVRLAISFFHARREGAGNGRDPRGLRYVVDFRRGAGIQPEFSSSVTDCAIQRRLIRNFALSKTEQCRNLNVLNSVRIGCADARPIRQISSG
jgi:hypothetical protein